MSKRYLFTIIVFVLWIIGFNLGTGFFGENLANEVARVPFQYILVSVGFYLLAVGVGILILYRSLAHVGLKPPLRGVSKSMDIWIILRQYRPRL